MAGTDGLIVQVKSRDSEAASEDDLERAELWCRKHAAKAVKQGIGTRKRLSMGGVRLVSLRGYAKIFPSADDWPIVVIIDHPRVPAITFEPSADTLYLSLEDWLGLHSLIRSTQGLVAYVRRALGSGIAVPLGGESGRYQALAAAALRWASFSLTAVPVLPAEPLQGEDRFAADLFSELMEMVADSLRSTLR